MLIRAGDAVHGRSAALPDVPDAGRSSASVAGAGLRVGGDAIQPPKPPPPTPAMCLTPAAAVAVAGQHAAAQAKFRVQLAAHRQAEQILREARTAEQHAHRELDQQLSQAQGALSELSTSDQLTIAGAYGGAVTDAAKKADNLIQQARHLGERQQ